MSRKCEGPDQLRVLIEVFVVHLLFQHLVQIDLHTHWECRCMYIWVQRFIRVSIMYIYILYTDIGIIHVCVYLFIYIYILPVRVFFVCVCPCVCVGVCVQIYFCMGLSLCTNILRANVSKRAGPFGTLGSPHVSASSKPSKLSTASSCFFFCLQIHWLIT